MSAAVDTVRTVTRTVNTRRGRATRLTLEAVQTIHIHALSGMTQTALAGMFGVGQTQISRILSGKRWADVAEVMS